MSQIHILDSETIDKIAAGEVVEPSLATAAMLESASPRNPRLEIRIKSDTSSILLVACRNTS